MSDLFDALVADDEPITGELGALWRNAQKVYGEILRVILESARPHRAGGGASARPPTPCTATDRIAKTIVLAALMPEVESMRDLTARKIVALNHGYIRSLVPGQESRDGDPGGAPLGSPATARSSSPARRPTRSSRCGWKASTSRACWRTPRPPTRTAPGASRSARCCARHSEVSDDVGAGRRDPAEHGVARHQRTAELAFGTIRDPNDLGDAMFRPISRRLAGRLRVPDRRAGPPRRRGPEPGRGTQAATAQRATVCWVPRRLTAQTGTDLGRYVRLRYALGPSFDQLAGHLSSNDRAIAKQQMTALAEQLKSPLSNALMQAYGVVTPDESVVDPAHGGSDMFVSLDPAFEPRVPAGAGLRQALDEPARPDARIGVSRPIRASPPRSPGLTCGRCTPRCAGRSRSPATGSWSRLASDRSCARSPTRCGSASSMSSTSCSATTGRPTSTGRSPRPGPAREVTVGQLRAWLDEPQPMGLPQQIADLVVLVFAEQTNRAIIAGGGGRQRAPDAARGRAGRRAALARRGRLDMQRGSVARRSSGSATSANYALPGTSACSQTGCGWPPLTDCPQRGSCGIFSSRRGPQCSGRRPIRPVPSGLISPIRRSGYARNLAASTDDVPLIDLLATFALPAVPLHVGKSLATAPDIVHAAERVDWPIFVSVAAWRPGHHLEPQARSLADHLAQAWAANEYATPLQPALATADSAARQLLVVAGTDRSHGTTSGTTAGREARGVPMAGSRLATGGSGDRDR